MIPSLDLAKNAKMTNAEKQILIYCLCKELLLIAGDPLCSIEN